jgi:hypothetical protein
LETYLARGGRQLRKIWVDQGYELRIDTLMAKSV